MIECIEHCKNLAITLSHLKQHLRMDHSEQGDFDASLPPRGEDLYMDEVIRTATDMVENYTNRSILYKVWRLIHRQDDYGGSGFQKKLHTFALPYPPFVNIVEIRDISTASKDGTTIKRYMLTPNGTVPVISVWNRAVEVVYRTGYGESPVQVPPALRQGITLIAGELYEKRVDHNIRIEGTLKTMLMPYRIVEGP